jgi:hypothetical protein
MYIQNQPKPFQAEKLRARMNTERKEKIADFCAIGFSVEI